MDLLKSQDFLLWFLVTSIYANLHVLTVQSGDTVACIIEGSHRKEEDDLMLSSSMLKPPWSLM